MTRHTHNGQRYDVPLVLGKTDRVALFVDGANFDGAKRELGKRVDIVNIYRWIMERSQIVSATLFQIRPEPDNIGAIKWLDYLSHHGFTIQLKDGVEVLDRDSGRRYIKCNCDVQLTIAAMNAITNANVFVIVSGDGDFTHLVEYLRLRGKRVYIICTRTTVARDLFLAADKPILFIEDHEEWHQERSLEGMIPVVVN